MPNRHGPFDPGMKKVKARRGSFWIRSRRAPVVTVIGRHSLPLVCRRPIRIVSTVAAGRTSTSSPYPSNPAARPRLSGPMGGMRTRLPTAAISGSVVALRERSGAGSVERLAPERRSSRTQWRNASTRVLVPASPACPSVSMMAKGLPSMRRA